MKDKHDQWLAFKNRVDYYIPFLPMGADQVKTAVELQVKAYEYVRCLCVRVRVRVCVRVCVRARLRLRVRAFRACVRFGRVRVFICVCVFMCAQGGAVAVLAAVVTLLLLDVHITTACVCRIPSLCWHTCNVDYDVSFNLFS